MIGDRKRIKNQLRKYETLLARKVLGLSEQELRDLIADLGARLEQEKCDTTLRFTREWCQRSGHDFFHVADSLGQLGGLCDCEVLANIRPTSIFAEYD